MSIFDKSRMNGRTVIQQLNSLFNMGSELEGEVDEKQGKLTAGAGITIVDDVISSTAADTYTKAQIDAKLGEKQDELTAGSGIRINNDVISATGYTDAQIDTKLAGKQDNLTAGTGIAIESGVISTTGYTDAEIIDMLDDIDIDGFSLLNNSGVVTGTITKGDGTTLISNAINTGKAISLETVAGSTANSFKVRLTLGDSTVLLSNDYTVSIITEDKYMTGLSFTPNTTNGTFYATVSYNDGTTSTSNDVDVRALISMVAYTISSTLSTQSSYNAYTATLTDGTTPQTITTAKMYKATGVNEDGSMTQKAVTDELSGKQATLVSGTNIKTINGTSVLGSGDITTPGGVIIGAETGYYTITDSAEITLTDMTTYWTLSWS